MIRTQPLSVLKIFLLYIHKSRRAFVVNAVIYKRNCKNLTWCENFIRIAVRLMSNHQSFLFELELGIIHKWCPTIFDYFRPPHPLLKSDIINGRSLVLMDTLSTYLHSVLFYKQRLYKKLVNFFADLRKNGRNCDIFLKLITCSRHRTLQKFEFQFSKYLFLLLKEDKKTFFHWSKKYFRPIKTFSCPPSINKNKYLENWNSNVWSL